MACVALNRRKYENVKPVFLHGKVVTRGRPFLNIRIHLTFIGWVFRFSTTAYNQVFSYTVINWYNTLCSCTTSIVKERIASNNANSVLDSQRFWVSGGGGGGEVQKIFVQGKIVWNHLKPLVRSSFLGTRPSCLPSPGCRFSAETTETRNYYWACHTGKHFPKMNVI